MKLVSLAAVVAAIASVPAAAKTVEVKMLNKGAAGAMVFEPALVKIAPGDSVTFTPTNPGHDAVSLPAMTPAGGETFKSGYNKAITVTFTKEGVYGYKCTPHVGMGMIGIVQVGKPVNKAQAAAGAATLPGLGKTRMTALLAQVR